jgi:gliding motility-associated-like protein
MSDNHLMMPQNSFVWNAIRRVGMLMFLCSSLHVMAQVTGIHYEVDRVFYAEDAVEEPAYAPLVGMVSYIIYADVVYETDWIGELYALEAQATGDPSLFTEPVFFTSTTSCYNHPQASLSLAMNASQSEFAYQFFPDLEYDSFIGLGALSTDDASAVLEAINTQQGSGFCGTQILDGAYYRNQTLDPSGDFVVGPVAQFGGEDLKVPIARITTDGDICVLMNLQFRPQGATNPYANNDPLHDEWLQANRFEMSEPLCFDNVCRRYVEETPAITGLSLPCPGALANVEVEFMGAENIDVSTMNYVLYDLGDLEVESGSGPMIFNGLAEGEYVLVTEDGNTCKDTVNISVVAPPPIQAQISLVDDNACFGEADALVELPDSLVSGGTGALSVTALSPAGTPVPSTQGPFGLVWDGLVCQDGDGDFTFTVSDANGCTFVDVISVNCPEPIEVEYEFGNVICAGDADGFIVSDASGGSGALFITSQSETASADEGLTDLSPGQYLVNVVDEFGCETEAVLFTITEPSPVSIELISTTPIACGNDCDGSVVVAVGGGSGDLSIGYFNTTLGSAPTDSISLCPGDHVATVVDTAGCTSSVPFEIDAPAPLDFLIAPSNATCTGMSNGSADIFPIGGTVSDQEYDWFVLDTAGNVANLNNLSEMTYLAVVTDQIGCNYTESFSIGVDFITDMVVQTFTSPVTCWNAADGTATVSVNGGEPPFTYSWSDPFSQTTSTAVGLTEDTYTVTVTDALGCRRSATQEVEVIEGCLFIADALTPNDDGKNDEWVVGGLEDFPQSELKVYNRWGQLLFTTNGGQERWDGRFNGARLPVADYYYTIELFPGALPIRGTVTVKY